MSTQTIQTIELPTDKKKIDLRKPSKPMKEVQQIYQATGCRNTQKAIKKYVVYHWKYNVLKMKVVYGESAKLG